MADKIFTFFLILSSSSLFFSPLLCSSSISSLNLRQAKVLITLKQSFDSYDPSLDSWNIRNLNSLCSWTGVSCDNLNQSITRLDISNLNISGTLSPEISRLSSSLVFLSVSTNSFYGELPKEIYKLSNLEVLNSIGVSQSLKRMKTISGLGIGLSLVFGFLLLALVAEIYYLLRWKKHKKRVISQESEEEKEEEQQIGYAKELIQLFCFKKPQALHPNNGGREGEISRNPDGNQDLELGLMKHLGGGDLGFEAELMKLHNQRFLFTIVEETKADLESEDGKSRSRKRTLSDIPNDCTNTPLASPTTLKMNGYVECLMVIVLWLRISVFSWGVFIFSCLVFHG